jgi:hypothetical protein
VAHMGEERKLFKVLVESPKERDHSEDQGVDQAPPWRVAGLLCFLLFRGNRSTATVECTCEQLLNPDAEFDVRTGTYR